VKLESGSFTAIAIAFLRASASHPIDFVSANPKMAAAVFGIDRRHDGNGPVIVPLYRPVGVMASHEIKSDDVPAAARTVEAKPLLLLRRSDQDELPGDELGSWINRRFEFSHAAESAATLSVSPPS
jgi:hypothetical protein